MAIFTDTKMRNHVVPQGLATDVMCCPCKVVASGCCMKLNTTELKTCYVISTGLTCGCAGAFIGGIPTLGIGAGPGFGIGFAVGTTVALIKLVIDEYS